MRTVSLESLRTLRDKIASLRVTRCRMFHERVRVENGAVLRVSRGEQESAVVRIGLCSPEVRARNLACGHTMARYVLLDAVQALHAAGMLADAAHAHLHETLRSVSDSIHLLDHQKGDAERQLALSSDGNGAEEVRRLEEQHDAYAEQIGALQSTVLTLLDAALEREVPAAHPLSRE